MSSVSKPGVLVAGFAPIGVQAGGQTAELRRYFESAWEACERLGMTAPIGSLGVKTAFSWPTAGSDYAQLELLAARQRPGEDESVYQAVVFAVHDSIVFVAMLAPNRVEDDLSTWHALEADWRGAGGPAELPAALLGEARVFTALSAQDPEQTATICAQNEFDALEPAAFFRSRENLFVWERLRDTQRCSVAVVAPEDRESELDRWTWWDNRVGTRGLERGLSALMLNVFKLRQEHRVFEHRAIHLREVERDVDTALGNLLGFIGSDADRLRDRSSTGELVRFQDALGHQQARSGGLVFQMSKLRELRQTLTAASVNIGLLTPAAHPRSASPLFARDLALAERLPQQLDVELAYAAAVQERAQEAYRLTSVRLQQGLEHQTRVQSRLTLLQTCLLGALLATLGATSTLNAHINLVSRVRVPMIALVAGTLLALPLLIVNWTERYQSLEYVVAGVYGAAWGWLLTSIAALGWSFQAAGAIAGAILAPVLIWTLETQVAGRKRSWLRRPDGVSLLVAATASLRKRGARPRSAVSGAEPKPRQGADPFG